MNKNNVIAVLDSGFGGISVLKQLINIMPNEKYVYFGDSINAPFGTKDLESLKIITKNILKKLIIYKPKEIVIACGTISTNILDFLENEYKNIHFVPTLPDFKDILLEKQTLSSKTYAYINKELNIKKVTKKLLFIATNSTIKSDYVNNLSKECKNLLDVYIEPASEIVKFVEKNQLGSFALRNYLENLFKEYFDIDYLYLGCTHFPFIINDIKSVLGENVKILDSSYKTSCLAKNYLEKNDLLNDENNNDIIIIDSNIDENRKTIYKNLLNSNRTITFL